MRPPPQEPTSQPQAPKPGPTSFCCRAEIRPQQLVERIRVHFGTVRYRVLGTFDRCVKCNKPLSDLVLEKDVELTMEEFAEAARTHIYTLEKTEAGGYRPWINQFLRKTELGKKAMEKLGITPPPEVEPEPKTLPAIEEQKTESDQPQIQEVPEQDDGEVPY